MSMADLQSTGSESAITRRVRLGAVQPVIAISLIAVGALLSVWNPRGQISVAPPRLGENDLVSAQARATVEWLGPNGRVLDSKVFPSIKVGYGAVDSSRLQGRLVSASYYGADGAAGSRLVASRSPSATESSVLANPLRSVADIAVVTGNASGTLLLGPTGRDSSLTIDDGHTQLTVRYGRPGEPDTLRTFVRDGRIVQTVHTSWTAVKGGRLMRAVDYDTPFPDGAHLHVRADLNRYVFASSAAPVAAGSRHARALAARSSICFTTVIFTSYGSYLWRACGGWGNGPNCGALAAVCVQDDYNMFWAQRIWDNCLADSTHAQCVSDSASYAYYATADSDAYEIYNESHCPAF